MDRNKVASELLKVAESLIALEFPTDAALKKYLKEHPNADKRNHKVVKTKPTNKPNKGYTGDIHKDLKVLLPHAVADSVAGQNREESDKLVSIAEKFYKNNPQWASKIKDTEKGRDTLKDFMQHWYDGYKRNNKWIGE